jgi:hypothetical protein
MGIKEMRQTSQRPTRHRRTAFTIGAVTLGVGISLITSEILLRAIGIPPWRDIIYPSTGTPALYEPHRVLGWRNRPGIISITSRPDGEPFRWTISADGRRSTGSEGRPGLPVVALIGCSFTQGIGLSDEETYAWNLQAKNPEVAIRNYGTGGYGTYQSLLVMERLCADPQSPRPELFLYGYIEHHEIRNVAAAEWIRLLASTSSRGRVDLPFCSIEVDGSLRRHDPEHYPIFPLMRYSSVVNQLHQSFMDLLTRPRNGQGRRVTERLIAEMDRTCRSKGASFAVLLLQASGETAAHYVEYCKREGVECYDVLSPMTADLKLPGDNHPNAKQNRIWAERIDPLIAAKLRLAQPGHHRIPPESGARVAADQKTDVSLGAVR